MQIESMPLHLIPAGDLGKLGTRCLECGAALDLSHTHPSFRYTTDAAIRSAIANQSAGAAWPCNRAPDRAHG